MRYSIPGYKRYWMDSEGNIYEKVSGEKVHAGISLRFPRVHVKNDKHIKKDIGLHVLVASVFHENPHNFRFVHHRDADPTNFHPDNLYWSKVSIPAKEAPLATF